MYASWDMECDRYNLLSFWAIFSPVAHILTPKIKICKKKNPKTGDILSQICTINEDHTMYGPWDKRQNRQSFLSFWAIFWSLTLRTTWKIKILKKKKTLGILSFYTCVPQITIIWYMVPEIWSTTECFSFWIFFCPFCPTNNLPKENFEKINSRYHDFTLVYQKSQPYAILFLRYDMWWMQLLFFILVYFLPFYPANGPNNQNWKKKKKIKKILGFSSIYTILPKIIIICYTVPEIWCLKNVIVIFHFGILFALFARVRQTDGQMDGSTEKVTHRGGCPTQNKAWHKKTRWYKLISKNI